MSCIITTYLQTDTFTRNCMMGVGIRTIPPGTLFLSFMHFRCTPPKMSPHHTVWFLFRQSLITSSSTLSRCADVSGSSRCDVDSFIPICGEKARPPFFPRTLPSSSVIFPSSSSLYPPRGTDTIALADVNSPSTSSRIPSSPSRLFTFLFRCVLASL